MALLRKAMNKQTSILLQVSTQLFFLENKNRLTLHLIDLK